MSKKSADQKTEKQTEAKQSVDLNDDEMEKVQGGSLAERDGMKIVGSAEGRKRAF